jgi:hypothetical protein
MEIPHILNENSTKFIGNFQGIKPFLISFQGANWLLMSMAAHHSKTKTPQMLSQHHYVVSLRS